MTHRALGALLLLAALVTLLGAPAGVAAAAVPNPPVTSVEVVTPITDNDFIPDRDLDDCVSALPQPGCGSDSRSGWRQYLVLAVLAAGLSFIGWRIVRSSRRARAAQEGTDDDA
jgi:hypothetical protein